MHDEPAPPGWLSFLIGSCYLFGLEVGSPLFCVAYGCTATSRVITRVHWRIPFSALAAAAAWALTYESMHLTHLTFTPVFKV